jgi:hypothetical protein
VLTVESEVTNPGSDVREVRLRSHLELDLGDLAQTRVRFTAKDGASVDKDMTDILAGLREGEHYYDLDAPDGTWTLSGTKGLEVTQSFDATAIDFTWLYAYPEDLGEVEAELWAPAVGLGPGESVRLRHQLAITPAP